MPSFSNFDDRRGGKSLTVKPIQYRQQVWTLAGALLLVGGLQLYAQQADLDAAAAAKAAAGREALTHAPAAVPGSVGTFISFDENGDLKDKVISVFQVKDNMYKYVGAAPQA